MIVKKLFRSVIFLFFFSFVFLAGPKAQAYAAITFTNLGVSANPDLNNSSNLSSYSTASWTPPTSGLIIVYVHSRRIGGPDFPTVTGNSLTWVQIKTLNLGSSHGLAIYAANASGATAGATTFDYGANTQLNSTASFFQSDGVDLSGGVAAAFVQSPTNLGTSATSGSVTLAAAASPDNRPIAGFAHDTNETTTPNVAWTEIDDLTGIDPTRGVETQWDSDGFQNAGASWTTSSTWGGIAAELKASGGGTPTPTPTPTPGDPWVASGTNIYNTNTGNVGISNTSPAYKLDVNGSLKVGPASGNIIETDGTNGYLRERYTPDPAGIYRWFLASNVGTDLGITGKDGGGIRFRSPGYLGSTTQGTLYTDTAITYNNLRTPDSLIVDGKVGIGTTSPGATLSVNGTLQSTGSAGTVTTQLIPNPPAQTNSVYVTFPMPFTQPPKVVITHNNSGSGDINIRRSYTVWISTTGFYINFYIDSVVTPGTTKFDWIAIQN